MNEALKAQTEALAFNIVLAKAPTTKEAFDQAYAMVGAELVRVVTLLENGTPSAPAPKRAKAPRKEGTPAPGGRSGIDPEALRAFLAAHKVKLDEIAAHFSVSKGVAQRAVVALGDAVKDEPAPKEEGKRGKPATVYWIA